MKERKAITIEQVVVVKCTPLNDPWECDCDRTPMCLIPYTTAAKNYKGGQYEWYGVMPNGRLQKIKECDY
jgi:hypothetical protein